MNIKNYYKYSELYMGNSTFKFGWKESDKFKLSNQESVISIDLKNPENISASTKEDYYKYFKATTGFSPRDFLKIWSDEEEHLELHQKEENKNYIDEEGKFLLSLAKLISLNKSFVFKNIKYKII